MRVWPVGRAPWQRAVGWAGGRSLRTQIVALTAAVTALSVLLLTLVLQLVLGHLATNDVDRVTHDRATSVIASIRIKDDRISVAPSQLTAGVAVYATGGTLVAGNPPENLREDYGRLRLTEVVHTVTRSDSSRIEARPFHKSGTAGVVIVSEAFGPYEEAERLALIVSIVTGLLTVAAAAAVAAWATRRALRPVGVMARTAADWSEHDLGRRFVGTQDGGEGALAHRTDELGALAETLDGLLGRVSAAIRSEQRLTAELAHELRTPLTSIRGEADLALIRDRLPGPTRQALERIVAASDRMTQTIATLLELARSESTMVEASRCTLAALVAEVLSDVSVDPSVRLDVDLTGAPAQLRLALPQPLAVRALGPVVENAARFAVSRVTLSAERDERHLVIHVEDDGPGVTAERSEAVFEPGVTSATRESAGGSTGGSSVRVASAGLSAGLGLAIARRVARSSGGDVVVSADSGPGASRFVVRLPLA